MGFFKTFEQWDAQQDRHLANPQQAYAKHKRFADQHGRSAMGYDNWLADIKGHAGDETFKEYLDYTARAQKNLGLTKPPGYELPTLKAAAAPGQSSTADPVVSENLGASKPQAGAPGGNGIPKGHVATPLPGYGGAQQTSGMIETMGPILNGQVPQPPQMQPAMMPRSGMTQTMTPQGGVPPVPQGGASPFTGQSQFGGDGLAAILKLLMGGGGR